MDILNTKFDVRVELEAVCRLPTGSSEVSGICQLVHQMDGDLFAAIRTLESAHPLQPGTDVSFEGKTITRPSERFHAAGMVTSVTHRFFTGQPEVTDIRLRLRGLRIARFDRPDLDVLSDSVGISEGRAPVFNCFAEAAEFRLDGMDFKLSALPAWREATHAFRQFGGIYETHLLEFRGRKKDLRGIHQALAGAMQILTLSTGTLAFYPEFTSMQQGTSICSYLHEPIIRPKMKDIFQVRKEVTIGQVAAAFATLSKQDRRLAGTYVHQLCDAANEAIFLQTRALSAVVIIERLLGLQSNRQLPDFTKAEATKLRRQLVAAAEDAPQVTEKEQPLRSQIIDNVRGGLGRLREKSFRISLQEYLEQESIGSSSARARTVDAATKSRNCLVHQGRFSEEKSGVTEYHRLFWIANAMVLRTLGVKAGFSSEPALLGILAT